MPRLLLILPTATYRAAAFLTAARCLGADVVVAADEPSSLDALMKERYLTLDLGNPGDAAGRAAEFHRYRHLDGIVGVDESAILAAAHIATALDLRHHPVAAVAATRDKRRLRDRLASAGVPQPAYAAVTTDDPAAVTAAAARLGPPVVVKPVNLAASRGVIRADSPSEAVTAAARVADLLGGDLRCGPGPWPLLVEAFVPGSEAAVEGLVRDGHLTILAVFDKPDPLDGPYFAETLYITPSRHSPDDLAAIGALTTAAVAAVGLSDGPIHAEIRLSPQGPRLIEIAARSIGGLCSRSLSFDGGTGLEEVIVGHALGLPLGPLRRDPAAAGVLMLPVQRRGRLVEVGGVGAARRVVGVTGVEIAVPVGERVEPLPEGDRYLGFIFAGAEQPAAVEASLRAAWAALEVRIGSPPLGLQPSEARDDDGSRSGNPGSGSALLG